MEQNLIDFFYEDHKKINEYCEDLIENTDDISYSLEILEKIQKEIERHHYLEEQIATSYTKLFNNIDKGFFRDLISFHSEIEEVINDLIRIPEIIDKEFLRNLYNDMINHVKLEHGLFYHEFDEKLDGNEKDAILKSLELVDNQDLKNLIETKNSIRQHLREMLK